MFIGHFGVALAAKRLAPKVSLGTLVLAAQFADLIWPAFLLLGLERVRIVPGITKCSPFDFFYYPYSHSLLALVLWGAAVAVAWHVALHAKRNSGRTAVILFAVVVSHWFLDVLMHRPDMPLLPVGGTKVGLGLWNSLPGTLTTELGLFGVGAAFYFRTTHAKDFTGHVALWSLLIILVAGWTASLFGAPPPNERVLAWFALGIWLLVLWAWWADHHREATE